MGTDNTVELDLDLSVLIRVIRGRLIWNQLSEECSQLACMFRDREPEVTQGAEQDRYSSAHLAPPRRRPHFWWAILPWTMGI